MKILICGPSLSEQNWIFGGFLKILVLLFFAHLWDVFFNQNSDLVSLSTPYSHNSGPILPGTKSTGAQEPGASRSVFGSWLGPFSWDEIVTENGCDFFWDRGSTIGHVKKKISDLFAHSGMDVGTKYKNFSKKNFLIRINRKPSRGFSKGAF